MMYIKHDSLIYTYGGFSNVVTVCSLKQRIDKCVNTANLADEALVDLIVARQIRQDSSNTCDNVDVWRCQQLNKLHQQPLHALLR